MRLDVDIKSGFFTSREVADGLGISLRTLKITETKGAYNITSSAHVESAMPNSIFGRSCKRRIARFT